MKLKIMYQDKRVEEIGVCRVFTQEVLGKGQHLYFETTSDLQGKGTSIPMSELKCWEVNAVIPGGNLKL